MADNEASSVRDLWRLVGDGETRTFAHTQERTGVEPRYYRVTTAGEYPASPRWENPLPIETRPRPAMNNLAPIPLGKTDFRFSVGADRGQLADLHYVTPGVFLVSDAVLTLLNDHGACPAETRVAQIQLFGGAFTADFQVVIPEVLDAVDIAKTDVKILRSEVLPGAGKFVTEAKFPNGLVFQPSAPPAFLSSYNVNWWWRESLVEAAVAVGIRGLRAVPSYSSTDWPEIRTP